jgi:CHAD domain-containing protein
LVVSEGGLAVLAALHLQQEEIARFLPRAAQAQAEAVHRTRVAARRIRSLLKTYADLFEPEPLPAYRENLRRVARWLEGVREADVLSRLLLPLAAEAQLPQRAQQRVRAALRSVQNGASAALRARLAAPAGRSVVRDAQVLRRAASTLIKCRKGLAHRPQSPAELHALRLRTKRCRYALEPVCGFRKRRDVGKVLRCLALLQTLLGEHRDTVLALHWVQRQAPALGQATVLLLAERLRERERQAREALGLVRA